jgi:hypothetical protein
MSSERADGQTDNEQTPDDPRNGAAPDGQAVAPSISGRVVLSGSAGHAGRTNQALDSRRWHRPSAERDDLDVHPSLFDVEEGR